MFDKIYRNSKYLISMEDAEFEKWKKLQMDVPGFVVIATVEGINGYRGIVENSFSLDVSEERTQFFWSSDNATSNFGGSFKIDGRIDAEDAVKYWTSQFPTWRFEIYDARDDEKLPVYLDWDRWLNGSRPAETLSGVNDKYDARNLKFLPK